MTTDSGHSAHRADTAGPSGPSGVANVTLRSATIDDALCLGVLATQVFLDTYAHAGISATLADEVRSAFSTVAFSALIGQPNTFITVAECDGALIGFAQTTLGTAQALVPCPSCAELDRLYVQEPFTRRSVGSRLLREHEALAAGRGAQMLWLSPWVGNHRALRFYAQHGYTDHGLVYFHMGPERIENRVYAKHLLIAQ